MKIRTIIALSIALTLVPIKSIYINAQSSVEVNRDQSIEVKEESEKKEDKNKGEKKLGNNEKLIKEFLCPTIKAELSRKLNMDFVVDLNKLIINDCEIKGKDHYILKLSYDLESEGIKEARFEFKITRSGFFLEKVEYLE